MRDSFELLQEKRLPWLDPELLKSKFLAASAEVHPDRTHSASENDKAAANEHYAELNAAYTTLREPRDRLLHLIELEAGARPADIQRIPPGTMDLFVEVGEVCREIDRFLSEREKVTSPLLKVQLFTQAQEWTGKLNQLQQKVNEKRAMLEQELKSMNAAWEAAPAIGSPERAGQLPLQRLEEIYRGMSYVARWTAQIQERVVQLAF